jgi:spermidine synthase
MLCVNLLSRRKDFAKSVARLEEAFDGRAIAFSSCDSGNAIALGTIAASPAPTHEGMSPRMTFVELKAAAKALKQETGLNLLPTISRLSRTRHLAGGVLQL